MRMEHVNLVVSDISRSLLFYQAAFPHWKIRSKGEGVWYGVKRHWVHFGDDYQYIALNDDGVERIRDLTGHQIGLAHIAFETKNLTAVAERLQQAGFTIAKNGASNAHRKNLYFIDPDGFEIEFVEYLSDEPKLRNNDN